MASKNNKLTSLGVSQLLKAEAEEQNIIVQVYDITETKNGKFLCIISDGEYFMKGYFNPGNGVKAEKDDEFTIICIQSHVILKSNIGIINFKVITKCHQKLGNSVQWKDQKENLSHLKSQLEFKFNIIPKSSSKQPEPSTATKNSTEPGSYESIDDLYVGLTRWAILCRITRKTLRESAKKGTKVLEIQLVDKTKKKILGTFFNQAAVEFNNYLKQGSVYEITKGRIIEGDYNNSRNEKLSCYGIVFDGKSQFNEVSDVNIISKSEDSAITLGEVYERKRLNQQYDIVAYVVQVKEQVSYQKEEVSKTFKEVIVADVDAKITMSLNLWGWKEEFGNDMVGKVVILSRFYLKDFKQSICLNNSFRSCIIKDHGHPMKKYENKNIDTSIFKVTTQARISAQQDSSDIIYNTKQLNDRVMHMKHDETLKSILYIWINRFAFGKKWYYQACPKCKKAADKYSKCPGCEFSVQQTNLRFILGTEISDFYGSIWITAHDQLAQRIFYDLGKNSINHFDSISEDKDAFAQALEKYTFQPLKLKIISKKDQEGRVKHNVGKLFEIQEDKAARANLCQIKEIISRRC